MQLTPTSAAPEIVAHRGYHAMGDLGASAPENSLTAVSRAAMLGTEWVEVDVHRSADGQLVLSHGKRLRGERIAGTTLPELRAAPGGEDPRHGVATLGQALERVAPSRTGIVVDVKVSGAEREILAELAKHLPPERIRIVSFRPDVIAAVEELQPELRTGLLAPEMPTGFLKPGHWPTYRQILARAEESRADFVAVHQVLVGPQLLEGAKARGLETFVWTVDDPGRLERYIRDGRIAGIITDDPEQALELRQRIGFEAGATARVV